jgi:diguanylate cyclase (GGDEF)-like protein
MVHGPARSRAVVLLSVAALIVVTALIALTQSSPAGPRAEWDTVVPRLLTRSLEGPLPTLIPETDNSRRAAVFVGVLIAGLLSLLYALRRRRYIAEWIGAWILLSLSGYVLARGYATAEHAAVAVGALEVGKVAIALLLVSSAHSFRREAPVRLVPPWLLLPLLAVWLVLFQDRLSVSTVLAPAYVISGLIHLRAAMLFGSTARSRRMVGALLLAVCLALVGGTNLAFGLMFERILTSGQLLLIFLSTNVICFIVGAFGMTVLIFEDMNAELTAANGQLRDAHAALEQVAITDALTGCNNRHFLEENAERRLQHHRRHGTPLCLLFVDIDHFKGINDRYGHETGDRVLRYLGTFLKGSMRVEDCVIRWGGDEFLILMTGSGAEAAAKASLLTARFEATLDSSAVPRELSLSIGYAEVPPEATDIRPFIEQADRKMYLNKLSGSPASASQ